MKKWIGLIALVVLASSIVWVSSQKRVESKAQIILQSDPFPLVVGPTTLLVTVTDNDGNAVDADLSLSGAMMHEGMLPLTIQGIHYDNGVFRVPVVWSMVGPWQLDISAELPNGQGTVSDQFDVFVYATYMTTNGLQTTFQSLSQNQKVVSDPAHELGIIIPQGTRMMQQMDGLAMDVIPEEIRLNVNGQNTLIIQNNDIVDHIVGPYMVRAGETMRQTFTQPAVYQGKCSINARATLSIIVDG